MPTPSIQTLTTDAQQVLNLDSISAVRSVVAVALANANTGTPLNPNLTTQQLWNEFYQVVTKPKSDIESIIANQLMKFLFAPPAPGGVGADKQVIFNDGGVLAGDPQFLWDKTTNLLTVTGSATITGDLTVRTNKLFVNATGVGVGTTNVLGDFTIQNGSNCRFEVTSSAGGTVIENLNNARNAYLDMTMYADAYIWNRLGSEAMRLNSTGLGVGGSPVNPLTVFAAASAKAPALLLTTAGAPAYGWDFSVDGAVNGNLFIRRLVAGTKTDVLEFDRATGNVGIGVAPSAWASYKALQVGSIGSLSSITGATIVGNNWFYDGVSKYITTAASTIYEQGAGTHAWYSAASGTAGTAVSFGSAKMTLDASGNLLVGTTSNNPAGTQSQFVNQWSGGSKWGSTFNQTVSSASYYTHIAFCTNGTVRGSIDANNAAITYGTVSDYRLKEAVQPLVGGLARISALKPSTYKWKESQSDGEGFIAHELASVVPLAVIGEKDAVNEDGSIKAQQVDLSKVVPVLVAAIQELTARVQTLETR